MKKILICALLYLSAQTVSAQKAGPEVKDLKKEMERQAADSKGNGMLKCMIKGVSFVADPLIATVSNNRLRIQATGRGKYI